jgi:GT2 family glycosyltransferase
MAIYTDPSLVSGLHRLIASGFIDSDLACPYASSDKLYIEEIVDSLAHISPSLRAEAFPFFDFDYYLSQLDAPLPDAPGPPEHFLRFGFRHRRAPHPLIQPAAMQRARPDLLDPGMDFNQFAVALTSDWCDPSPFLWLTWYRARAGLAGDECALLHYLKRGAPNNLPPNPYFEPDVYAASAPDAPRNGVALVRHFLEHGDVAQIPASDRFDPAWYVSDNPEVLAEGVGPLTHFLSVGRRLGRAPKSRVAPPPGSHRSSRATSDAIFVETPMIALQRHAHFAKDIAFAERARIEAFRERPICPVRISDPFAALKDLAFAPAPEPDVDILIPCYNEFEKTVECLLALQRAHTRRSFKIIVADDASPDERMQGLADVPGLTWLRHAENLHFLGSCNRAFASTSAPFLLLLNNDTQVLDDAVDLLVDAVESHPGVGAAAPMFLYPNGRLQEAGCTLRHDGDSAMTGVGDDPALPAYNYRRDIDYGSAAGLMIRREALDGRLFDELFAPAYCEDADLCLRIRAAGWRIVFEPKAKIVHHLSASTSKTSQRRRVQQVRANQQKLMEKWGDRLARDNRARVLAFYLPQFHPIARNDLWWGKGFTDWTNVTRALPSFDGHYQPHLPADLGFYDLRRVEVMGEQQALARRYGVEGFVVYYYNFGATHLLEQPMETLLARPDVDFRYALCWANENWTRHWDGGAKSMLLEQQYDEATLDSVAADLVRFAADPRAIRVDGKPLVLIYRPLQIPDVAAVAERLRLRFREAGCPAIHLVYVESMEAIQKQARPTDLGFDACVEFPPQGVAEPYAQNVAPFKAGWEGCLYDYAGTARNASLRPGAGYARYPAVIPSWDNTARQPLKGTTLVGSSPELFQAYVEQKLEEMLKFHVGEERLLFVNAWNEWAEGAHLEPDRAYGHRWLTALRQGLLAKGLAP